MYAHTQVTVAKAVEKVAAAVKEKTDALQQEVEAQQARSYIYIERERERERERGAAGAFIERGRERK